MPFERTITHIVTLDHLTYEWKENKVFITPSQNPQHIHKIAWTMFYSGLTCAYW